MCVKSFDKERNTYWKCNGVLHNPNGPSIIKNDGTEIYYLNGLLAKSKQEYLSKKFRNQFKDKSVC